MKVSSFLLRLAACLAVTVTGITLHSEASDRLAGWVVEKAGDIPAMNQIVSGDGYRAMVRSKRRNRITSVLLESEEEGEAS